MESHLHTSGVQGEATQRNLPTTATKDDSNDIGRQDLDSDRYLSELEKMCVAVA